MDVIEKRKKNMINLLYFGMILGIGYLLLKYAFGLLFPFIFAFFLAAIIQKPVNAIANKTPLKKGLVASVMVLLIVALIVTILVLTGARIVAEIRGLVAWVGTKISSVPQFLDTIREKLLGLAASLPQSLSKSATDSITEFFDNLMEPAQQVAENAASGVLVGSAAEPEAAKTFSFNIIGRVFSKFDFSMLSKPVSGVWNTAKQIPSIAVGVVIAIIASCFMAAGYDDIVNFIKRQIKPEKRRALSAAKGIFFSSILKMLKSYVIIICITFAEMCIGLTVLKLIGVYKSEYLASVAVAVALIDIFPVLGTGTVLVPWSIVSFINGNVGMGIGLLVLYAVITVIRQILEPKLVAANLGLPPVVTIMCMYIGLQLFGVLGIFILPLLITMIKLLNDRGILHLWKTESEDVAQVEAETVEEEANS